MKINHPNILECIIKQIHDSVTFCRLSSCSKSTNTLCKRLLIKNIHYCKYFNLREFYTYLPCGLLHGNVRGERSYLSNGIIRWYYHHNKTYVNGKLNGYFTIGSCKMEYFIDGIPQKMKNHFHNSGINEILLHRLDDYIGFGNDCPPRNINIFKQFSIRNGAVKITLKTRLNNRVSFEEFDTLCQQ